MWPYMVKWGYAHYLVLFLGVALIVLGCIFLPRLKKKYQLLTFWFLAISTTFVILWRFIIHYEQTTIDVLFRLTLQVCNFNFLILPLACIRKFKFPKHYLLFVQALGALFMFFAGDGFKTSGKIYDFDIITYWYYHWVPIALPIFMIACKEFTPKRKYIIPTFLALLGYFYLVTVGNSHLMAHRGYNISNTYSSVFYSENSSLLSALYDFIPVPMLYLLPIFLFSLVNSYIITYIFELVKDKTA